MRTLIDGYNLIHESGIQPIGENPVTMKPARDALLSFLLRSLTRDEMLQTVVVYDARDARPGLPKHETKNGINIHFAADYEEADDLIEELIRSCNTPKLLTVVSSDHRIQKAAQRRHAKAIDSDEWFDLVRFRKTTSQADRAVEDEKGGAGDSAYWLSVFEGEALDQEDTNLGERSQEKAKPNSAQDQNDQSDASIFPPEYLEELDDEFPL